MPYTARTYAWTEVQWISSLEQKQAEARAEVMKDAAIPLWQRGVGLALVALALLTPFSDQTADVHTSTLWLPILKSVALILGALLITRAILAIALATSFLAWSQVNLDSDNALDAIFFPALALAATVILCVDLVWRFRQHMQNTHEARWENRSPDKPHQDGNGSADTDN